MTVPPPYPPPCYHTKRLVPKTVDEPSKTGLDVSNLNTDPCHFRIVRIPRGFHVRPFVGTQLENR
jgi:hypothetical protein